MNSSSVLPSLLLDFPIVGCHLPQGSKIRWREDMGGGPTSTREALTLNLSACHCNLKAYPEVARNNIDHGWLFQQSFNACFPMSGVNSCDRTLLGTISPCGNPWGTLSCNFVPFPKVTLSPHAISIRAAFFKSIPMCQQIRLCIVQESHSCNRNASMTRHLIKLPRNNGAMEFQRSCSSENDLT